MTKQRHLSDEEKTKVLQLTATGASPNAIAKQTGRDRKTIKRFIDQPETRVILADKFEDLANRTLDEIGPEDFKKASLQQKAISAGVFTDKALLLRGQPTQISVSYLLDAVDAIREMREREDSPLPLPAAGGNGT